MTSDQMDAWRSYFAGKLHDQYGIGDKEAKSMAARWIGSLKYSCDVPTVLKVRHQRNLMRQQIADRGRAARA